MVEKVRRLKKSLGGAIPTGRLRRYQPEVADQARRPFLQPQGTAEQWIKEDKNAVQWTKLSCRRFKDNEARLQLFALSYNLANFLRQLVLPKPIQGWTLTTLREKLIKIGAKVVAQPSTSPSSWRKSPFRGSCSPGFWSGSPG